MNNKIIYTADEEEPDCCRCDNVCERDGFCKRCGETGWSGYRRTEIVTNL